MVQSAVADVPVLRPHATGYRAIRYARRPPGQLTVMLSVLVLLCLGAGLAGALDIQRRGDVLAKVVARGGLLTGAAVDIYQSLSDADATAASAFLLGGREPPDLLERYRVNITETAAALSAAATGSPAGESAELVADLAVYLPVYTGLVETARTYNRQGFPQGATFLREASGLVQNVLLPKAQRLYQQETAQLAADQAEASAVRWFPFALGVLALAGLVAAQVYLARTTRRILNAGLLGATVFALAAVGWFVIASVSANGYGTTARQEGTAQVEMLAAARIAALQARTDESLTLVARGNGSVYETAFQAAASNLTGDNGLLAKSKAAVADSRSSAAVQQAIDAWNHWLTTHQRLRMLDNDGDYNAAIRLAVSQDNSGTAALSAAVDGHLGVAIQQATDRFEDGTLHAMSALSAADAGVGGLMVLAGLGVGFGFAPRIREFR